MQNNPKLAAAIQQSMLPVQPPNIGSYRIVLRIDPVDFLVGDFYDFFEFDKDTFGFCIGDAAGRGLQAALLVRDVVVSLRMGLEKELKLVHTIKKLNRLIHQSSFSTRLASLFYGEIEPDGRLIYVNAGHPPPFLIDSHEIKELPATGTMIGIHEKIDIYRSYERLDPGAFLLLYSDGVIERRDTDRQQFGIRRLKDVVWKNREKTLQQILDAIFSTIYEFGGKEKWHDDTTVILIKRTESEKSI